MGAESEQPESIPFKVDLRGVVDLLSRNIYSGPRVYLRELLQNAQDAVVARHQAFDGVPAGAVTITPAQVGDKGQMVSPFVLRDNGVGLSIDDATNLLATVGRSSKRDETFGMRREGFLGQFGIGLLSCFMVSDHISIRSRSAHGARPIEWVGSSDGSFQVRNLHQDEAKDLPIGTEVTLWPRLDEHQLTVNPTVSHLAKEFAGYLPIDISVSSSTGGVTRINSEPPFIDPDPGDDDLWKLGTELCGARPLAILPIVVPVTGTRGVAFILPTSPSAGARPAHRAYLGRMLLGTTHDSLLPSWAFFARAVVNSDGLTPTASREAFVENDAYKATQEAIGQQLRTWLAATAAQRPDQMHQFVDAHWIALKSMAAHDDELLKALLGWLEVETSHGRVSLARQLERSTVLRYVRTVDEFRQIAPLVHADEPVINAGYSYDIDLLQQVANVVEGVELIQVSVSSALEGLATIPLTERNAAQELQKRIAAILIERQCEVTSRCFDPIDIPALYVYDPLILQRSERRELSSGLGGQWGDILTSLGAAVDTNSLATRQNRAVTLCLNWSSPLIRTLAGLDDDVVLTRVANLLYAQAQLASHRPLGASDRRLVTEAILDLVQLSIGLQSPPKE